MVWRVKAYVTLPPIIVLRGTLTGQRYVDDILRHYVGTFLSDLPGAIFSKIMLVHIQLEFRNTFYVHVQTLPWPTLFHDCVRIRACVGPAKTQDAAVSSCT